MKKILLFTFLLFTASALFAQKKGTVKIDAYKQSVIAGKAPGGIITEGGTAPEAKHKASEAIFIYTSSSVMIEPLSIWIKGKEYRVEAEKVTTPVMLHPKKELVPRTTNKVLRLIPKDGLPKKHFAMGKSLANKNDVVVFYVQNGKYYYAIVEKFSSLLAAILQ